MTLQLWRRTMRFPRSLLLVFAACIFVLPGLQAQSSDVTMSFLPTVTVPIGPTLGDGLPFFDIGGGGSLRGELAPGFARWLFGRAFIDYELLPINGSSESLSVVYGGGALGASFSPAPRFALRASAGGGIYMAVADVGTVRNPFVEGGAEFLLRLSPSLAAGLGARYKYLTVPGDSLYQGLSVQLGVVYDLAGSRKGTDIQLAPDLGAVFPLFFSFYDKNPLGTALITNDEALPIEKVKVLFYAKQYMDAPRLSAEFDRLAPGASTEFPVYALFNDAIFRVTEGTKAAGELTLEYYYLGRKTTKTIPVTLNVQNRNAMTWDDDRKAAAFVTAKDPLVLGFAKGLASMVRNEAGTAAVSSEFRTALAVYQALRAYGLGYAVDPKTPYISLSEQEDAIDFLQFPSQTLAYRAGDCDDLSVLFAALLEAVGIETALVTTPGHIFVAFDSGLTPENAARAFSDSAETIVRNGKVWIPIEVTLVKDGFLKSWSVGAMEWRDGVSRDQASFYPIREAWQTYEPIGFAEGGALVSLPAQERLLEAYKSELDKFSRGQIMSRVAELQAQIKGGKEADKAANRLGILYAQFGLIADARAQFQFAINKSNLQQALVNMGNVEFLDGQMAKAKTFYERALKANAADTAAPSALPAACRPLAT
jgi:tetratricopeptide (TPR) repeat protein